MLESPALKAYKRAHVAARGLPASASGEVRGYSKRAKERWGAAVRQAAGRVARQRLLARKRYLGPRQHRRCLQAFRSRAGA